MNQELIIRLRKVLALSRRGCGGEKESAERILQALLKKNNLSLQDIDSEVREWAMFPKCNKIDYKLLLQVVATVLNTTKIHGGNLRGHKCFKVTPAERVEIEFMFDVLRPVLKREIEDAKKATFKAFIYVNNLLPDDDNESPDENRKLPDPGEIKKVRGLMDTMLPVNLRRQLTAGMKE